MLGSFDDPRQEMGVKSWAHPISSWPRSARPSTTRLNSGDGKVRRGSVAPYRALQLAPYRNVSWMAAFAAMTKAKIQRTLRVQLESGKLVIVE